MPLRTLAISDEQILESGQARKACRNPAGERVFAKSEILPKSECQKSYLPNSTHKIQDKLQYFRIRELKDVLTQLGLSKQGKKQDLIDRIMAVFSDDEVSKMGTKKHAVRKEEVARLVDDTYRKMQVSGATDLASSPHVASASTPVKPKEEIDDSPQVEMKIRCLCASSLLTESMIKCEDPKCQIWQHISCVIIPENPIEGILPVPPQFYCEVCRLTRADPFWLTVGYPLYPVKLMITSMPTDGTNPVQGVEKTFQITRTDKNMLSKPEYDVQAWCILLNDKVSFRMHWPQYADLHVNGVVVRANNRPGNQLLGVNSRDDGPIITPYTRDGINKISLTGRDARLFCLGVRIVKRRTLQQILSMIPKESDGERFEDALARVRRCVTGGRDTEDADSDSDVEVVADSFTINLRCPMSGSRIKVAGRFRPCAHMGCFDLNTYVEMQQRSRKWQCPICLKNYSLDHVIIDPYFNRITSMMRFCGEDTTDIEVKPDASWRVKGDSEEKDLKQWHCPDGSVSRPRDEIKPKSETPKVVKQEGTGLKLGIRKNSNGVWEVSKHSRNTVSSGERLLEHCKSNGQKGTPTGGSASVGGKECEGMSMNQDANDSSNFAANNGVDLDSVGLNLDQSYDFANKDASSPGRDADIIVLSDSDEENGNMNLPNNGNMGTGGVNFSVVPHGLPDAYQEDPALGAAAGLDLFSSTDDDFGLWQLPATQAGPSFQVFGQDAGVLHPLADLHHSSMNCPVSVNDYSLPSEVPVNPTVLYADSSVGHPNNNDLNDGLVDNTLAFAGDDPSLQLFLPTSSSVSLADTFQHQQAASNGHRIENWISLRVGDSGGKNHGEAAPQNGFNSGHLPQSNEGTMQSLADPASMLLNDTGSNRSRQRSDGPFSVAHQHRSVRQRTFLSIDTDSE